MAAMDPDTAQRPIGVIVAMEAELVHLLRLADSVEERSDGIWRFRSLSIGGRRAVALCCGMGTVNAAAGTERLIAAHDPSVILNFGCSGAHRREIMPGDVMIADRVVLHSAMRVLADGSERHTGSGYEVAGEQMNRADLPADPTLLATATRLASSFPFKPWPIAAGWPGGAPHRAPVAHVGAVASADIWTQWTARLDVLHARHGSLCEDMEAAAIAQIAARHGTPFLSVKDISNNEYLKESDLAGFADFPVAEIGKRAAALIHAVILHLDAPS